MLKLPPALDESNGVAMWKVEVSGDARAARETVWAWYEATDQAPSWDPLIKRIESEGPIELGVRGRNHPAIGPAARFVYSQVTPLISYTEVSFAPGAAFAFTHALSDLPGGPAAHHPRRRGVRATGVAVPTPDAAPVRQGHADSDGQLGSAGRGGTADIH